ncbi:MAG: P-loop NTPase fold protein [Desulfobacterales bacterium]
MEKKSDLKNIKRVRTEQNYRPESEGSASVEEMLKEAKLKIDPMQQAANKKREAVDAVEKDAAQPVPDEKQVRLQAVSDRARKNISEDALNFKPTVRGLVSFLKNKDTEPPLAMAVNGRWGQGKTSFMQMVESKLRDEGYFPQLRFGQTRFATTWFNPWKFSEPDKVWASFVDVITRCIRSNLGWLSRIEFEFLRFYLNLKKRFNIAVTIRLLILVAIGYLIYWLVTDSNLAKVTNAVLLDILKSNEVSDETIIAVQQLPYKALLQVVGALFIVYQLYFKVVQKFNLGLLEYLRETDFSDKIGTLAEFDVEMEKLNACIPKNLKIVIFIDDLDRCKPGVLLEIIQALQLLHVSERCIFILGLDLEIVSSSIEEGIPELSKSVGPVDGNYQHGRGYQFLEKIIHTRINVPYYSSDEIETFIAAAIGKKPDKTLSDASSPPAAEVPEGIVKDSPEVERIIKEYGKKYLYNPRRIKKFINTFRLYVHLAKVLGRKESIETIARFLILIEKWPGVVEILRTHPSFLDQFQKDRSIDADTLDNKDEKKLCKELLLVLKGSEAELLLTHDPPISSIDLVALCEWVGFQYYTSNERK